MKYYEETISSKKIFEGKILDLEVTEVKLPNKKTASREIVRHNGAVAIIAVHKDNIILVKQFRKAVDQELLEIPAGKLEKDELPVQCAERELEEETGYRSKKISKLGWFFSSPGFSDEVIHLFLAEDLIKTSTNYDEDEFIDIIEIPLSKVNNKILDGEIIDSKTIIGILMYLKINNL